MEQISYLSTMAVAYKDGEQAAAKEFILYWCDLITSENVDALKVNEDFLDLRTYIEKATVALYRWYRRAKKEHNRLNRRQFPVRKFRVTFHAGDYRNDPSVVDIVLAEIDVLRGKSSIF